jgi:glycosyltransferase involved in cell wall biosynthesis
MGQRKGLGDLMAAVRTLGRCDVELVVMGTLLAPRDFYESQCPGFVYERGRPHDEVIELMRSCDVLCLPSIVEGRALVMQEAMSQGLSVIITPNTGGADLVESGPQQLSSNSQLSASGSSHATSAVRSPTGFLVPIRSPEAIATAIAWYADHRNETIEMGKLAQEKAGAYTWESYGQTIVAAIDGMHTN